MHLPKPSDNGSFETTPAGTHTAICYRFIDKGTQMTEFNGDKKSKRQIMLTWELPDELMTDGRPFSISKTYTFSMHEKANFRKDLEAWRGKAFVDEDFEGPTAFNTKNLLGKPCTLTITHETKNGDTFAKVAGVGQKMKGITVPPITNQLVYLALTPDGWDAAVYGTLSDKMKATIAASPEYREIVLNSSRHDDPGYPPFDETDAPF